MVTDEGFPDRPGVGIAAPGRRLVPVAVAGRTKYRPPSQHHSYSPQHEVSRTRSMPYWTYGSHSCIAQSPATITAACSVRRNRSTVGP